MRTCFPWNISWKPLFGVFGCFRWICTYICSSLGEQIRLRKSGKIVDTVTLRSLYRISNYIGCSAVRASNVIGCNAVRSFNYVGCYGIRASHRTSNYIWCNALGALYRISNYIGCNAVRSYKLYWMLCGQSIISYAVC